MEKFRDCNELLTMVIGHLYAPPPEPEDWDLETPPPPSPPSPRCVCYATVSRQWQAIVEKHTMAKICVKSSELDTFAAVYKDPRRRGLLKRLKYTIVLPTNSSRRRDHAANRFAFKEAVMDLFSLLGTWEQQQQQQQQEQKKTIGPLDLELDPRWHEGLPQSDSPDSPYREVWPGTRRYLTLSAVEADGQSRLPILHSIAALTIGGRIGRAVHPSTACALAAAVAPGLNSLELQLFYPSYRCVNLLRKHRAALAAGLLSALRGASHPVRLALRRGTMTWWEPWCHDYGSPDLKQDLKKDGVDELSEALKLLGREGTLAELELVDVLVAEELFQGSEGDTWPNLRRLSVQTGLVAASPQWWYTVHRDAAEGNMPPASDGDLSDGSTSGSSVEGDKEDVDPQLLWRTTRTHGPDVFDSFMEAAAGAVLRMPALEHGRVEVKMWYSRDPSQPSEEQVPLNIGLRWAGAGVDFDMAMDPKWEGWPTYRDSAVRQCQVGLGGYCDSRGNSTTPLWEVPESVMTSLKEWAGDEGTVEVEEDWPQGFKEFIYPREVAQRLLNEEAAARPADGPDDGPSILQLDIMRSLFHELARSSRRS